jgi:hypothetical protein
MTDCVIFDIDGTLADVRHRLHYVSHGGKDWPGFFAMMGDDPVHQPVARLLRLVHAELPVVLCSGRPEDYRDATERWLSRHGLPYARLYMRAKGDFRQDAVIKRQILAGIREDGFEPILVVDDRQQVVDMWREEGLTCLQVAPDDEPEVPESVIGKTLLTVMVGPSGGGKSLWCEQNCTPHTVLSSDQIRKEMSGDFRDQTQNDRVFAALHEVAKSRLKHGLPVVIDATHLRRKDRLGAVALAPKGSLVRYVVINRPMPDKLRDGGWRLEVAGLMERHEQTFNSQIKDILAGDGLSHVEVADLRSSVCSR